LEFNICDYSYRTCPDKVQDFASFVDKDGTCTHLSSGGLSSVVVNLLDSENPSNGLNLDYFSSYCNTTHRYNLNL